MKDQINIIWLILVAGIAGFIWGLALYPLVVRWLCSAFSC
jgi:hypothetical protein